MVKMGWPVLPIRYEMLVHSPAANMRVICDFLGIPFDSHLLLHHTLVHDETFDGVAVGNTLVNRPIDDISVMKFSDILTVEQEAAILEVAGELNDYVSVI